MLTTVEGKIILSAEDQTGNVFGDIQGQLNQLDKQGQKAFDRTADSAETALLAMERFGKAMAAVTAVQIAFDFKAAAAFDRHAGNLSHLQKTLENLPRSTQINYERTIKFAEEYRKRVVGGYDDILRQEEIAAQAGARTNEQIEQRVQLYNDLAAKQRISGTQAAEQLETQLKTARGLQQALRQQGIDIRPGQLQRWQQQQQHMSSADFGRLAHREYEERVKAAGVLKGHAAAANEAAGATERLNDATEIFLINQGKGSQAYIEQMRNMTAWGLGQEEKWGKLGRIAPYAATGAMTLGVPGLIAGTLYGAGLELYKQNLSTTPEDMKAGNQPLPGGVSAITELWRRARTMTPEQRKMLESGVNPFENTPSPFVMPTPTGPDMRQQLEEQGSNLLRSNEELKQFSFNLKANNDEFERLKKTAHREGGGFAPAGLRFGGDLNAIKPGSYDPRGKGRAGAYALGGTSLDLGGLPGGRFGGGGFGAGDAAPTGDAAPAGAAPPRGAAGMQPSGRTAGGFGGGFKVPGGGVSGSGGGTPLGTDARGGPTGALISKGEGGYGSFNRGFAGDARGAKIDFSTMTVGEIMAQQAKPRGDPTRLFAVGKYQVIPSTMREAVRTMGINPKAKFTPELQESIYRNFLIDEKRPQVRSYVTGQGSLPAAQQAMAQEFASVASPYTGRSLYGGTGGNAASISPARMAQSLTAERAQYAKNIAAGMNPDEAWSALSGGTQRVAAATSRPSPIEVANREDRKMQLGRGRVDVQLKLDKNLQAAKPSVESAEAFDIALMVDRTGSNFARPGDPSFVGAARI